MKKIQVIEKNGALYFQRLTLNQRIQHVVIFVSFTLLAATGLPLKFHHTWWGERLYDLVGGIAYAPLIHRISAVTMTLLFLYHILYVTVCAWKYYLAPLKREGRLSVSSGLLSLLEMPMVPNLTDLRELGATLKYFLFITSERPSLVAHGLKEKFGYLAVFWGIPVIGISGYFLWGETFFTRFFTGNVLNFAYIAHSDEAFLASIVIFIWHLYNVHAAPAVFPMGKAWLNGYVSEREMVQYHYRDYLAAMRDNGLQDRIRDNRLTAELQGGFFRRALEKIFMGILIVAVSVATVVIVRVIYESVFVLGYQIVTTEPVAREAPIMEPRFLEEIVLEKDEDKTFYRGYRLAREKEIKNHYHRIELEIGPDRTSHCIKCHGDLPHGTSEHLRAFLNMHNLYFACQTCHIRPAENRPRLFYYWYRRSTGDIVSAPDIGDRPIDSLDIKLTPCETCQGTPERETIENERAQADRLHAMVLDPATTAEKKKGLVKDIHKNIANQPLYCKECHNKQDPFLPLEEMGYPQQRVGLVSSDQITKMIEEYKEFHTPTFLEPGQQADER